MITFLWEKILQMKQIKEKFKFYKDNKIQIDANWDEYKTDEEVVFEDYKLCVLIDTRFSFMSVLMERDFANALINDLKDFFEKNKNKIYYGFDFEGAHCLSDANLIRLLNLCGENIGFMQTSSDFEASIEYSFDKLTLEKINLFAGCKITRLSFNFTVKDDISDLKEKLEKCRIKGINKINFMVGRDEYSDKKHFKKAMLALKILKPEQIALAPDNKLKFYQKAYNCLLKMGYYNNGDNLFSLNKEDLGVSSLNRNVNINNISYQILGKNKRQKSEKMFKEKGVKYLLPQDVLLKNYLFQSLSLGMINLEVLADMLIQDPSEKYKKEIKFLNNKKLIKINNNLIKITKKGLKYKDAIFALFAL